MPNMADEPKPSDEALKLAAEVYAAQQPEPKPASTPTPDVPKTDTAQPDKPDEKTPPDPAKVQALLQMAEMQSMGGTAGRKSPFKPLVIVLVITILLCVGSYFAVLWAVHHP